MPVFYQQKIDEGTKLGIWHIREDENFFKQLVPLQRDVTHAHKRLQHLAGRFLLKYLFPKFPSHLIKIADTRKPFLVDEAYHFSISHCGDYAAAIVSLDKRVGIDIEITTPKVMRIQDKFLTDKEKQVLVPDNEIDFTRLWSAKEAVFKWYGDGEVDFKKQIQLLSYADDKNTLHCFFEKNNTMLDIHLSLFHPLNLAYVFSEK